MYMYGYMSVYISRHMHIYLLPCIHIYKCRLTLEEIRPSKNAMMMIVQWASLLLQSYAYVTMC